MQAQPVLGVFGPTASGKSALGMELARRLGGEIINVDSVQVYRGFDIGSAKPSEADRRSVPHHLLDLFEPGEEGNASRFVAEADTVIASLQKTGTLPVFVGGTGMYLTALLHGLAEMPAAAEEMRARLEQRPSDELHAELLQIDPATAARLHVNDRLRVIRALEMYEQSGKRPSDLYDAHAFRENRVTGLFLVLCPPRVELYRRIDERVGAMLRGGLVEEVRGLRDQYGDAPRALRAIGYREVVSVLKGEHSEAELETTIATNTRRYAKRQMTYWRNEPAKRGWNVRPREGEGAPIEVVEPVGRRRKSEQKSFSVLDLDQSSLVDAVRKRLAEPFEASEVWYIGTEGLSPWR